MPVDWYRMTGHHCTKWLVDLDAHPNIIADGVTRKLEDLILTTIPYHCSKEEKSIWLDRGSTIRRQTGKTWMVLHHVPPKTGSGNQRRGIGSQRHFL